MGRANKFSRPEGAIRLVLSAKAELNIYQSAEAKTSAGPGQGETPAGQSCPAPSASLHLLIKPQIIRKYMG